LSFGISSFSETKGTVFSGLDTPEEEVLRTLAMIPEKGSIRGVARATGNSKDTICKWVDSAGFDPLTLQTGFGKGCNR
jgi:hypothetical protein